MNKFAFQIKTNGEPRTANLRFAAKIELQRYHQSLSTFAKESSVVIREAVEFTRLAAKRWRYYSRMDGVAESFAELASGIRSDSQCEIAFIMVATVRQSRQDLPVGLAYCRRTWCHHLALDFLAVHPRAMNPKRHISGVGSGMVFGLVQLARALKIRRIWGEATVNSAPFYEKLLAVAPVQDLFIIEAREMTAITIRQEKTTHPTLVTSGEVALP